MIKSTLELYVSNYNLQNNKNEISLENLSILNEGDTISNKPGGMGCFLKNNKWYVYYIDDRFTLMVNGPFSENGVIVALAKMLYIPSQYIPLKFTDAEYEIYLSGEKPIDNFKFL